MRLHAPSHFEVEFVESFEVPEAFVFVRIFQAHGHLHPRARAPFGNLLECDAKAPEGRQSGVEVKDNAASLVKEVREGRG